MSGPLKLDMPRRDRWTAFDFGAKFNGSDDTTALQTAVHETRAAGRSLWLPDGLAGVSAPLTDPADNALPLSVRGAGKGMTRFQYTGTTGAMFSAAGTIAAATTLSAPTARRATVLPLASTVGLAPGDLIVIRDPTVPILGNAAKTQAAAIGQMRKIRSVDSGTQVTLWAPLSWAFTTGSDVRKITSASRLSLTDFSIENPAPGTLGVLSRAMTFTFAQRIEVARVDFRDFDSACVYLQTSWDFRVTDCDFYELRDLEQPNNPYSIIAAQGAQHGLVRGCKQHYGRHLFTTGPSADGLEIPSQDVLVDSNVATGAAHAPFDCHPGSTRIHYANNAGYGLADACYQIRGPDCTISNPLAEGALFGILAVDGADRLRVVSGGRLANCDVGIELQDSGGCFVGDGLIIDSPITTGLKTTESAQWPGQGVGHVLEDITVRGNPSGAAFDFSNKWDDSYELSNLRAPDATTKILGAPTTPTLFGLDEDGYAGGIAPTPGADASLTLTLTANQAQVSRYVPKRTRTITKLALIVTTAAGSDDPVDVGIFSLNVSVGVLTRISSLGATLGQLNAVGRKVLTIPSVKLVKGTVYYIAVSCGAVGTTAATILAGGFNSTTSNQLMGTGVPDLIVGSKAASHPLPATISGPSAAITGPKVGVLE